MQENVIEPTSANYPVNLAANGHVKIWNIGNDFGKPELVYQGQNLIVKGGSDILASALSGKSNSAISHFYIGYSNDPSFNVNAEPAVAVTDTVTSFPTSGNYGYIRIPLAFPASYLAEAGYTANVPYFTTFLVTGGSWTRFGAILQTGSKIFSLGLINAKNSSNSTEDVLFSKIYLNPTVAYDTSHGAAVSWGVTFRSLAAAS